MLERPALYLVAVPIGNPADVTQRAVEVLEEADVVVCEEPKEGRRLLRALGVEKPLLALNEHNEGEAAREVLHILKAGRSVALVSDAGTPAFEDPGATLVGMCMAEGIRVLPVPGPSALSAIVSLSPVRMKSFLYRGLLPAKREEREKELARLAASRVPVVIFDTPYRLGAVLSDVARVCGKRRKVLLGFNLTMEDEEVVYGEASAVAQRFEGRKGEFCVVIYP